MGYHFGRGGCGDRGVARGTPRAGGSPLPQGREPERGCPGPWSEPGDHFAAAGEGYRGDSRKPGGGGRVSVSRRPSSRPDGACSGARPGGIPGQTGCRDGGGDSRVPAGGGSIDQNADYWSGTGGYGGGRRVGVPRGPGRADTTQP